MENIEVIVKNETPITCNNKKCEYRGDIYFCYNNDEEICGIYKTWKKYGTTK